MKWINYVSQNRAKSKQKQNLNFEFKTLTWIILVSWYFFEAVVEWQVVSDGILPARFTLVVEREVVSDVLIYLTQGQPPVRCSVDSHGDQSGVGIRWPDQLHQVFLRGQREPAQLPSWTPSSSRTQVRPLHAVVLRDEGRARIARRAGSSQIWRCVDSGTVEPEVRVRGGGGVVAQVVGCWRSALWTRQRGRRVVTVTVHAELGWLLAEAWELWATPRRRLALGLKWRHCQISSQLSLL